MRAAETNFAQCVRNLAEFTPWPDVAPRTAVITVGWQLSPDPVEAVLQPCSGSSVLSLS